jgi:hypothetical protein
MKTLFLGRDKLEIYDSIDELPVKRYQKFNKYMLVDAGIGSDLNDINDHIFKIARYIDKGDVSNAKKALSNMRQALYLVSQETNAKHLSYMALIKSVNGKEVFDISDENLKRLLKYFDNQPKSYIEKLVEFVKKKISDELALYFPAHFDDAAAKEYYQRLKRRTVLQLSEIVEQVDNSESIEAIDDFLFSLSKPQSFSGKNSAEIRFDKQFEEMCLFLKKELNADPEEMTVLQFYNSFEYIKKTKKDNGRKSD